MQNLHRMSSAFRQRFFLSLCFLIFCYRQMAVAQDSRQLTAVVEIQDFSEEKALPVLLGYLDEKSPVQLISYCPNQDLVIIRYDANAFESAVKAAAWLGRAGLNVYLKDELSADVAEKQCITGFKKLNSAVKTH